MRLNSLTVLHTIQSFLLQSAAKKNVLQYNKNTYFFLFNPNFEMTCNTYDLNKQANVLPGPDLYCSKLVRSENLGIMIF